MLYARYPIVARALGLAVHPLGRVRAREKVSCIQQEMMENDYFSVHKIQILISLLKTNCLGQE